MNKKSVIVGGLLLIIVLGVGIYYFLKPKENYSDKVVKLMVNGATLQIKLLNNSSAEAFYEKLNEGHMIIETNDYGSYEKIGDLGFNLSTNDEEIKVTPGDLVLQGGKLAIYYAMGNVKGTKIGKIQDTNEGYLKTIFGSGNVRLEFSK